MMATLLADCLMWNIFGSGPTLHLLYVPYLEKYQKTDEQALNINILLITHVFRHTCRSPT